MPLSFHFSSTSARFMNAKNAEGAAERAGKRAFGLSSPGFIAGIRMLQQLTTSTPRGIYWGFLAARAESLEIPHESAEAADVGQVRLKEASRRHFHLAQVYRC